MAENVETAGIKVREEPIETPGAIGTVEGYHAPLRAAYNKVRKELSKDHTDAECLKMAIFAINLTIGLEGMFPMLLTFGVIPLPARKTPSPTQMERADMIERTSAEITKLHSRMPIPFGLKHTAGPKRIKQSKFLRQFPAGSPVLTYRTTTKKWEVQFSFISL